MHRTKFKRMNRATIIFLGLALTVVLSLIYAEHRRAQKTLTTLEPNESGNTTPIRFQVYGSNIEPALSVLDSTYAAVSATGACCMYADSIAFAELSRQIMTGRISLDEAAVVFQALDLQTGSNKHRFTDWVLTPILTVLDQTTVDGPESAQFWRTQAQIVLAAFNEANSLSFSYWHKAWDFKLGYHEDRFEKFLYEQIDSGNLPTNTR